MNGKVDISVDEVVSALKKTSLPTVIIEGKDDIIIFRKLERLLDGALDVLPVGGRNNVFSIFERRSEFSNKNVVYIADRDLYVITGVPEKYIDEKLIFTNGFSIENDIFLDVEINSMFTHEEVTKFKRDLDIFCRWYSLAVKRIIEGKPDKIRCHPKSILQNTESRPANVTLEQGEEYPEDLFEEIKRDAFKKVRGKSLLGLALIQLSTPNRKPIHTHESTFFDHAAVRPGELINSIFSKVEEAVS